jgi:hypothetical protein
MAFGSFGMSWMVGSRACPLRAAMTNALHVDVETHVSADLLHGWLLRLRLWPRRCSHYMGVKFHLEDALGARVDLVTDSGLKPRARPIVEREALDVA